MRSLGACCRGAVLVPIMVHIALAIMFFAFDITAGVVLHVLNVLTLFGRHFAVRLCLGLGLLNTALLGL